LRWGEKEEEEWNSFFSLSPWWWWSFCCLKTIHGSLEPHPPSHTPQESRKERRVHFQTFIQIQHIKSFTKPLRREAKKEKEKESDFAPGLG
jgi:hypothetical protein